jgi:CelD/BcsL family acetyltransferase involved in cellulose biosynthesis
VAAAVGELLRTESWDELVIGGVRRADFEALAACCIGDPLVDWRESPYVDLVRLRAEQSAYLEVLSRNTRQQIRRSLSLYEARGRVELRVAADIDQAQDWYQQLIQLHQKLWQARGKPGAFASPRQRAFHERIIATGLPRGEVQLLKVDCGEETIGILYNLCHSGHISYYQSGFRYEDDNRLKPGLVCHALAVQRALVEGYREYDFLAAANDGARYKQSLSNASRQFGWVVYRRQGLRMSTIDALAGLRRRWQAQ